MTAVVHGGHWFDETDNGEQIRFTSFDAHAAQGDWLQRMATISPAIAIKRTEIKSPMHLVEYVVSLRNLNAEGVMFRSPYEVGYHAGRTGSLLRWKF
jgi:hypothetical protein